MTIHCNLHAHLDRENLRLKQDFMIMDFAFFSNLEKFLMQKNILGSSLWILLIFLDCYMLDDGMTSRRMLKAVYVMLVPTVVYRTLLSVKSGYLSNRYLQIYKILLDKILALQIIWYISIEF